MQAASLPELKRALKEMPREELVKLCARLAVFKKENKELLTYLLFEADHEASYVASVKEWMNNEFNNINSTNFYLIKKSVRKILKRVKTYIRYSKIKETEVALLIHFCEKLLEIKPSIHRNRVLKNSFERQLDLAIKKSATLHPDLQYDFDQQFEKLQEQR